ncbi:MAG: hypothetical protein ACR2FX_02145 [Chthoniobacterales bacterium]
MSRFFEKQNGNKDNDEIAGGAQEFYGAQACPDSNSWQPGEGCSSAGRVS